MYPSNGSLWTTSLLAAGVTAGLEAGALQQAPMMSEAAHDLSRRVEWAVSPLDLGRHLAVEQEKWQFRAFELRSDGDIEDVHDAILERTRQQQSLIAEAIEAGKAYPLLVDTLERARQLMVQNWLLGLFECHCADAGMNRYCNDRRFQVEQTIVQEMTERFSPETPSRLRYLSLGSGGGLQDFFTLGRLLKAGLCRIEATLYDPEPVEDESGLEDVCILPEPADGGDLRAEVIHSAAFQLLKAAFAERGGSLEIVGADGPSVPPGPWHCISAIDFDALYEREGGPLYALAEAMDALAPSGRLYLTQGPFWSNFSASAQPFETGFWGYDASSAVSKQWPAGLGVDGFEKRLQECLARLTPQNSTIAIDAADWDLLLLVCKQLRDTQPEFPITIQVAPQHFATEQAPALSQLLSQVRGAPVHVQIWASAPPPEALLLAVFSEEPSVGYWPGRKRDSSVDWLAICWNPAQERYTWLERD
jgi:hypothetical protein